MQYVKVLIAAGTLVLFAPWFGSTLCPHHCASLSAVISQVLGQSEPLRMIVNRSDMTIDRSNESRQCRERQSVPRVDVSSPWRRKHPNVPVCYGSPNFINAVCTILDQPGEGDTEAKRQRQRQWQSARFVFVPAVLNQRGDRILAKASKYTKMSASGIDMGPQASHSGRRKPQCCICGWNLNKFRLLIHRHQEVILDVASLCMAGHNLQKVVCEY